MTSELHELVAANVGAIRDRIAAAGRDDVVIVGVTKRQPLEVVEAAVAAGVRDLGENYVQELVAKADATRDLGVRWHQIGQLQSNKVRQLAGRVHLVHTLDRPSLVPHLASRLPGVGALVQVDLAGLAGRGGCGWDEAGPLVEAALAAGVDVRGLMGVAPPPDGPGGRGAVREAFGRLARLRDELGLAELSIGMSQDLDEALEAGATLVRVGSAIFGQRPR